MPNSQEAQEPRWSCRDEGSIQSTSGAVQSMDTGLLPVACDTSSEVNSAMSFSPYNLLLVEVDS